MFSHDVVITTYHTVGNESQRDVKTKDKTGHNQKYSTTGLFEVPWHRVVLDEAHLIKNRNAKMSKAMAQLTN